MRYAVARNGRAFMHSQAAIADRKGLLPGGRVRGQIFHRHAAARLVDHTHDGVCDLTPIEHFFPCLRDPLEGTRQVGIPEDLSRARGAAVDGQLMPIRRGAQLSLRAAFPGISRERRNRKPFRCQPDGGRQAEKQSRQQR